MRKASFAIAGLCALALGWIGHALAEEAPPLEEGRRLFRDTGCVQCHTLADAGGVSTYAPSLDGNAHISKELVFDRLTKGKGDMPSFTGILSEEELATLADYVSRAAVPAKGAEDGGGKTFLHGRNLP